MIWVLAITSESGDFSSVIFIIYVNQRNYQYLVLLTERDILSDLQASKLCS